MRTAFLAAVASVGVVSGAAAEPVLDLGFRAVVTGVAGGGTLRLPGGAARAFEASEIPNFAWKVGDELRLDWSLTREEVRAMRGPGCGAGQAQLIGVIVGHRDTLKCNEALANYSGPWDYYYDSYEMEPSALGPVLDLTTGALELGYDPNVIWLYYCCGYVFDPAADAFTAGTPEGALAQSDNVPYIAWGEFGLSSGELVYQFNVDLVGGTDPATPNRDAAGEGLAAIAFDVFWEVRVNQVPAPAGLGLFGLGALALGLARVRLR